MRLHATRRAAIAQGRGLGNPLWDLAGVPASLDQRFAESKSLVDAVSGQQLITFTRASDGAVVNSAGQIEIVAANVPRFDHNPVTGESLGLLVEEQRTQLLELTDALATQTKTVAAAVHTLSFYGTGTVALSGAHSATVVGAGAYPVRTTLTFTPTAGALTLTVTGTVQFGQLEAGAFATSYIPNTGTGQVTRSADVASITGANFSSWYRQDQGTVFVAYDQPAVGGSIAVIDDETANNAIVLFSLGAANQRVSANMLITSVNQGRVDAGGAFTANVLNRAALAVSASGRGLSCNGSAVSTAATPSSMPSLNRLAIQGDNVFVVQKGVRIRRLCFFPQRLPNSTLQNITL